MDISKARLSKPIGRLITYYPMSENKLTDKQIADYARSLGIIQEYERRTEGLPDAFDGDSILGAEVEIEQVSAKMTNHPAPAWTVVSDSSLRNNGMEFISVPLAPKAMREALILALTALEKGFEKKPNFSWRTSIHFHLNMRKDSLENLLSLFILYALSEDALFEFIGEQRRHSNFCVPIQDTDMSYYLAEYLSGETTLPHFIGSWQKYSALNPRPLRYNDHAGGPHAGGNEAHTAGKGSIEFRHMEGTFNLAKIIKWMNLITRLQAAARRMPLETLQEKISAIRTKKAYMDMLEDIYGPSAANLQCKEFSEVLNSSVAYAKECFYPIPDLFHLVKRKGIKGTGIERTIKIRTNFQHDALKKKAAALRKLDPAINHMLTTTPAPEQWSTELLTAVSNFSPEFVTAAPDNFDEDDET